MSDNQSSTLNAREASILAISLGAVGASLGSISFLSSGKLTAPEIHLVFLLGYFSALFGLFYREITILQTSLEEKMIKDENSKKSVVALRFLRGLSIRLAQVSPMIIWMVIGNRFLVPLLPPLVVIFGLVMIALVFALVEWKYLWLEYLGPPILFDDPNTIRSMIRLADPTEKDTFYDLGCGYGENLIMFAKESKVRRCVGIERDKDRLKEARRRVAKLPTETKGRIELVEGNNDTLFSTGVLKSQGKTILEIKDASIIFYGLSSDVDVVSGLSEHLKDSSRRCKLIYYFNALIPEIKADRSIYPFYLSQYPFKKPTSELDWLKTIYPKQSGDLWERLRRDYESLGLDDDLLVYRERLAWILKSKLRSRS